MASYFKDSIVRDGYDTTPREDPFPRGELPDGHIAFMGDFTRKAIEATISQSDQIATSEVLPTVQSPDYGVGPAVDL